jgi:hypothetical protein
MARMMKTAKICAFTLAASAAALVLVWGLCTHAGCSFTQRPSLEDDTGAIPGSWLTSRTTAEAFEREHDLGDKAAPRSALPAADDWEGFKSRLQKGDELWEYTSPPESWRYLAGQAGLCVVRQGHIVDTYIVMMN